MQEGLRRCVSPERSCGSSEFPPHPGTLASGTPTTPLGPSLLSCHHSCQSFFLYQDRVFLIPSRIPVRALKPRILSAFLVSINRMGIMDGFVASNSTVAPGYPSSSRQIRRISLTLYPVPGADIDGIEGFDFLGSQGQGVNKVIDIDEVSDVFPGAPYLDGVVPVRGWIFVADIT